MDSITQAALGATVAAAGFRGKLGLRAVALGALVGTLPDLDIFTRALGPWSSLRWHRGPTHSLLLLPLVAPLVGWICWHLARRKGGVKDWIHLSVWCLVTHPLLDLFTSYGTQLFSPLSSRRFAIDGVAIVDPIYTGLLLLALLAGLAPKIGKRIGVPSARVALLLSTAYLFVGLAFGETIKARARRQLASSSFREASIRCTPTFFNNLLWHVVVRHDSGDLLVGQASILVDQPIAFRALPWTDSPLVRKALDTEEGRLFRWFAASTLSARLERNAEGTRVHFHDHRYGLSSDPRVSPFGAVASFDGQGRYLGTERERPGRNLNPSHELALIWKSIWEGPDANGEARTD